jgi:hypothetical protein
MDIETATDSTIIAALNVYACQKEACRRYQKAHPDKCCARSKNFYYRIKENPDRYAAYLETRRLYQQKQRELKKAGQPNGDPNPLDEMPEN